MPVKFEEMPALQPPPDRLGPGRQIAALLGFLAVSQGVSFIASLAIINNANGWYAAADKASWTPPGWAFGSAWMVLYTAMAVAAWLVWRKRTGPGRDAMRTYGLLLVLNLAWAPLFFGMYPMLGAAALWLAFLVIAAHAAAAAAAVVRFGPVSRTAGLLMLPYLSWIVFSASLNLYAAANN